MAELGDFLYKISPLILGMLAFFILPASERAKNRRAQQGELEVTQGKTVEFDDKMDDREQEREIARLKILCAEHGIEWRKPEDIPKKEKTDG